MLNNKADVIEEYILKMLANNGGEQVELKRTDLADEVSCAPSQVSYVLSTRFTNSRGFKVESQRGLGGYIRITILNDAEQKKKETYKDFIEMVERGDFTFEESKVLLDFFLKHKFITVREAEIIAQNLLLIDKLVDGGVIEPEVRQLLLRNFLVTLSKIT